MTLLSTEARDPEGCPKCKTVRRRQLDPFIMKFPAKHTVIASGYTLFDFVSYVEEVRILTDSTYDLQILPGDVIRYVHQNLCKIRLIDDLPTGYRIVRPLAFFTYAELENYRKVYPIPILRTPCQNYSQKFKRIHMRKLNRICTNTTYESLLSTLESKNIAIPDSFEDASDMNFFSDC